MLRNCATCGRLLTLPEGVPCPSCLAEEDAAFDRIRRYLEDGGVPSRGAVSRQLGLRISVLNRLQASGRIQLTADRRHCRICAVPLDTGEVCPDCLRKFGSQNRGPAASSPAVEGAPPPRGAAQSRMYGRVTDDDVRSGRA